MGRAKGPLIRGYIAAAICVAISCLWSFWGATENFHEGWYGHSLFENLSLMMVQYLSFPLGFILLSAIAVRMPVVGAALFAGVGLAVDALLFRFSNSAGNLLVLAPCMLLAALFSFSDFPNRRKVLYIVAGIPVALILGISTYFLIRVNTRMTAISRDPLSWQTPVETLIWAPPGPGWPEKASSYEQAMGVCEHLEMDGETLSPSVIGIWRLPTVDESVRALEHHGRPAGCRYRESRAFQPCRESPDKEAPLWNPFSPVIYWWTSSDDPDGRNLRVAYNGYVLPVRKIAEGSTGFRLVRTLDGLSRSRGGSGAR